MRERINYGFIVFVIFIVLLFTVGFCKTVYGQDSTYLKKLEQNFNFYQKQIEHLDKDKKAIDEDIKRIEGVLTYIRIEFLNESKRLDSLFKKKK